MSEVITTAERKRVPKGIDLFAGAGGFSLGMQEAGIEVVAAVEIERAACDTLYANKSTFYPSMEIIEADISNLTGEDILNRVGLKKGELDILFGGPPCHGFSTMNTKMRGVDNPKSKLMWEFIRMVDEIQPKVFSIENVPGLLGFKDFFYELLESLEVCGYVVRFNKLNAAGYGVPQTRKRIFIEGSRNDLNGVPTFPVPTHFTPEALEERGFGGFFSRANVAQKCFAINGFAKEEVKDVWWNSKLDIMMNKKTAGEVWDRAIDSLICEIVKENLSSPEDVKR